MLLSSGLDSTVNLAWSLKDNKVVTALTFDYGQVSALKEISRSKALCELYQVPHLVVNVTWFSQFSKSSLNSGQDIPLAQNVSIDDLEISQKTAKSVWVPNRNGIFLNIAAGFAEGADANKVIAGFNLEEASTFPDNSSDFLFATNRALEFSTANKVKTTSLTIEMNKTQIVKKALELKVPLEKMWPCYQSFETWCGDCESCQRFKRALFANGIDFEELSGGNG